MKAIKANKEYDITEAEKKYYLNEGYDIYENGKVIEYSPKKTIAFSEYQKVQKENEELKKKTDNSEQIDTLEKEIADLKVKLETAENSKAELEKNNKALEKEIADLKKASK